MNSQEKTCFTEEFPECKPYME